MRKLLTNITTIICTILIIWGAFSYAEIITKNTESNPKYSSVNLWVNLVEGVQE